jgi:hypothetical protein
MTHAKIIDYYYGRRQGLTLKKLSMMTGYTRAQLCAILFER